MSRIRKMIRADINGAGLGDDEVEVVMSTAALARDGHVLIPSGAKLDNYRANPIVLWSHDSDKPIGNVEDIAIEGDLIRARVRFAPLGISHKADEIRGLVKAGVVRAVSVGFDPIAGEPIDPRNPKGGQRFAEWELWELSFCSVPVDPGSLVTARAHGDNDMADQSNETDNPTPITRTASPSGSRRVVIATGQRSLYQVAQLANLVGELGYQVDWAKWEANCEGDGSQVPAMMADALYTLGDAFVAMAQEEVAELFASVTDGINAAEEADEELLEAGERAHVRAATSARVRALRRAVAVTKVRAGKKLSASTAKALREAKSMHEEAIGLCRSSISKHKEGLAAIDDLMERSGVSDPEDTDSQTVQTSSGTDESEGSSNGRSVPTGGATPADDIAHSVDYRRRQADLLAMTADL